jgi:predicted nucleic-acid-binding protein
MVTYLADTNIFIRLYTQGNSEQRKISEKTLKDCKDGRLKMLVLSEVIPEIEYVLRKVYKIDRKTISDHLFGLVMTTYINIEKRDVWKKAIKIYSKNNIDIVDAILFVESQNRKNEILSFDKDFKKVKS